MVSTGIGTTNNLLIWNVNDFSIIRKLEGHRDTVLSLALLKSGYLASGGIDKTIRIWNTNDGSSIKNLTGHSDSIYSLAVLQNGYLVSGSSDQTIKIWNTNDGSVRTLYPGYLVLSLAVLSNDYFASGLRFFNSGKIKIWNINDESELIEFGDGAIILPLPNGNIMSGGWSGAIKEWDVNGNLVRRLIGHGNSINGLALLPNGYLASCSEDYTIKIWYPNDS